MGKKILETFLLICIAQTLALGSKQEAGIDTCLAAPTHTTLYAGSTRMSTEMLKRNIDSQKNVEEFKPVQMYTNTSVNLREGSGTDTPILVTLYPNEIVTLIHSANGWAEVTVDDGQTGFIFDEFLSEDKTPISELNRWGVALADDEIELLAKIVWKEAEGENQQGKEAVVEIVFNRMISKEFGGDLYSVLSSKGQFSSWKSRDSASPGLDAYKAIKDVLYGRSYNIPIDYLYFSTTKANGKDFIQIGRHYFGK